MSETICFEATVAKVQTLVDFGLRITLDLSEDAITQAAQLMECKRQGIPLMFEAKASDPASTEKKRK
jgi:hypothetical protein